MRSPTPLRGEKNHVAHHDFGNFLHMQGLLFMLVKFTFRLNLVPVSVTNHMEYILHMRGRLLVAMTGSLSYADRQTVVS